MTDGSTLFSNRSTDGDNDKRCAVCSALTAHPHHHHTLRDEYPYDRPKPGSDFDGNWRNDPRYMQWLCEEHHLRDFHELFEPTKWPEGFGFEDRPFRRGDPEVERVVAAARERRSRP